MGNEQSVHLIIHFSVRTVETTIAEIEELITGRKSLIQKTCLEKLKESFASIASFRTLSKATLENVWQMFYGVVKGYDSCNVQVVIVELMIYSPENTVAALLTKKMMLSGVDRSTLKDLVNLELGRIEKQFTAVIENMRITDTTTTADVYQSKRSKNRKTEVLRNVVCSASGV